MTVDVKQAVEKTYSFGCRDSRNGIGARTQAVTGRRPSFMAFRSAFGLVERRGGR